MAWGLLKLNSNGGERRTELTSSIAKRRGDMLNVVITWLILDIVAIIIVLYDYRQWYGRDHDVTLAVHEAEPEEGRDIETESPWSSLTPSVGYSSNRHV